MSSVYILLCSNGKYYVGSTTDLVRRLEEHAKGRGCGFTKAHLPFQLVYSAEYATYEEAYARERQIHGWSRTKKEALIRGDFDELRSLSRKKKWMLSLSK